MEENIPESACRTDDRLITILISSALLGAQPRELRQTG
jgi:hypothetical protein